MIIQNLLDGVKVVPRVKFMAIQSYLRTQEKPQISSLILHLKMQEKGQMKSKVNRRKEIKIRAAINQWEEKMEKINETKSWGF